MPQDQKLQRFSCSFPLGYNCCPAIKQEYDGPCATTRQKAAACRPSVHREKKTEEPPESRPISASYPNHIWSIGTTKVLCWGLRPHDFYYGRKPETPKRRAKTVPGNIERHVFTETRLTADHLKDAA